MEVVTVYLHGTGDRHRDRQDLWYRVEFPLITNGNNDHNVSRKRKKICPIATLCHDTYGSGGSWEVIGDNIYWAGGIKIHKREGNTLCKDLLKHNINHADPSSWEIESSSMQIPRKSPFLVAIGSKKLCFVAGTRYHTYDEYCSEEDDEEEEDEDRWNKCGEIYDLENKSWKYIDADYNVFSDYDTSRDVALVEKDGEEPRQIVFCESRVGTTLFLNVTSGELDGPVAHMDFAPWHYSMMEPQDSPRVDDNNVPRIPEHFCKPEKVNYDVRAVFTNDTLYWISYDLCIYGYDINEQRWLKSTSLEEQLGAMVYEEPEYFEDGRCPILVSLQDGKFMLIFSDRRGELTMACLMAIKEQNSLTVLVESVQHFSIDDHSFRPSDAKAMLKGMDFVKKIEPVGADDGKPSGPVKIVDCGEIPEVKSNDSTKAEKGKDKRSARALSSDDGSDCEEKRKCKSSTNKKKKKRRRYASSDSYSSDTDTDSSSDSDSLDSYSSSFSSDGRRKKRKRATKKDIKKKKKRRYSSSDSYSSDTDTDSSSDSNLLDSYSSSSLSDGRRKKRKRVPKKDVKKKKKRRYSSSDSYSSDTDTDSSSDSDSSDSYSSSSSSYERRKNRKRASKKDRKKKGKRRYSSSDSYSSESDTDSSSDSDSLDSYSSSSSSDGRRKNRKRATMKDRKKKGKGLKIFVMHSTINFRVRNLHA